MKRITVPAFLLAVAAATPAAADLQYINQGGVGLIRLTGTQLADWRKGALTGLAACTKAEDLADGTGICPQVRCIDDTRIVAQSANEAILGAGPLQPLELESGSYDGDDWGAVVISGTSGTYEEVVADATGLGWITLGQSGPGSMVGVWGDSTGRNGELEATLTGCHKATISWKALTPPLTSGTSYWQ